jgi:hypothetical protein
LSRALSVVVFLVTSLMIGAGAVAAAEEAFVSGLTLRPDGVRMHVAVPDAAEPWQELVALPPGMRARLTEAPAGVTLGEVAVMHGVRLTPLSVAAGVSGAVAMDFVPDPGAPPSGRTAIAETFASLFEQQVIGGAALRDRYDVVPGTYLMIVSAAAGADAAVQPLADWRRRQGYDVQVVNTVAIGSTSAAIKAHIQQVYDTAPSPLAYVCLVGDATGTVSLATWRETISGYNGEGDHYYTTLDGGDVLADVHIGRLSARTVSELQGIVQKILAYERTPDTWADPGWLSRAVLVGDPSSSGTSTIYVNQWLKEQLLEPLGYTDIDTIWTGPFASQMFAGLNQGASVYSYRGFWGMSGFSTGYIDMLSNGGELPFAVMPTCGSGSFYSDSHSYTEAMLRNANGGAIGAVGTATTGTHTRYNNCYFHGVWQGALGEPDRHLGYAHTRGKLELYRQYGAAEPSIVEIWSVWNNLMGDPATEMRQGLPDVAAATYPATLPPGAGSLPVQVETSGGAPLAGALVTASRDDGFAVSARADAGGAVLLPLPTGLAAGSLDVTVTGDDLVPHLGQATVGAVTAYCAQDGWTWDDGDDGMPDPGETGQLTVTVRNFGQQAAGGVVVELSARDDQAAVTASPVDLGDLAAGAASLAGPWTVTLADDLPDGDAAALTLLAGSGGEVWRSRVDLPVSAPAFAVTFTSFPVLPGGAGQLVLSLTNEGSAMASGTMISFASGSPYLVPTGPVQQSVGDVAPGSAAAATFDLLVPAEAWGGHLAACRVTVTTAAGTRQVLDVPVGIGAGSADSPVAGGLDYLAWDGADPHHDAPVYQFREIAPVYGGPGEDVGLTDFGYEQDDTRTVDLPFTFRFDGTEYDRVSICSNGWVSLGQTYLVHWRNWGLPCAGAPDPLLAVFWDDLVQSGDNRVYHHYDAEDGVYVVQWCRMRNLANGVQNCEIVLYDPAVHPTATGDGLFVYQYQQVTNNDASRGYATVGVQSADRGVNYTYYNRYAPGARSLAGNTAIAWAPVAPQAMAAVTVTPGAVDVVLQPGQTTQRTLTVANEGAAGSQLGWWLTVQPRGAVAGSADDAPADRDPTVTVLSPNGGETWNVGENRAIRWNHSAEVQHVRLQVDRGLGGGWETLADGIAAVFGTWTWLVDGPTSSACRVRVVDTADFLVADASDATFTITAELSWIAVSQDQGTVPAGGDDQVILSLDATGLVPGSYSVDLVIMSNGGAPVTVPVNLLVDSSTAAPAAPDVLSLAPNAPNPFNPATVIAFTLPSAGRARLTVHDLRGRLVATLADGDLAAGRHQYAFHGADASGRSLPSGTYIYRLATGGEILSRRMTLVK